MSLVTTVINALNYLGFQYVPPVPQCRPCASPDTFSFPLPCCTVACRCGVKREAREEGRKNKRRKQKRKQPLIVGGQEADLNEYPWMVGLADSSDNNIICGASLIASQWVLTAAHCFFNTNGDIVLTERNLRYTHNIANEESG